MQNTVSSSDSFSENPERRTAPEMTVPLQTRGKALKPATLALLIQCASFLLALLASWGLQEVLQYSVNLAAFVLLQGSLALLLSKVFGMDSWWRVIQFVFPVAALFMHSLQLPGGLYLAGFIISLSLFWTTFRTQVPFYPSRLEVWQQVLQLLPKDKSIRLVDIGSGLGDLVMYLAKAKPRSYFLGVEIAPLPCFISKFRAFFKKSNAQFLLADYNTLDFSDFEIVFAYLSPAAMQSLWEKAAREMKSGSMLISYEFEIPDATPSEIIRKNAKSPAIYVWRF